jgi:hypothetical protein
LLYVRINAWLLRNSFIHHLLMNLQVAYSL